MEGGNKTPIDLEAGLNISTSDMLTPLAQQSFQHNWQKYQGKFLPNSLRFEKNGWAAGWNVYNFDYNTYRKSENGYYVGIGQFNTYVETLNIYDSEEGYNPLHTTYVVPDTVVTVGDLTVNGNIISGKVKDKNFQLTWDPVSHLLSCADTTIELTQTVNSDYSVSFTVKDLSSSFSYDFDLLLGSKLTGSAINNINYTGFNGNEHSWGQYTYNVNTGVITTPEGVTVTPTVTGNEVSFDYNNVITDETENISYSLLKYYIKFTDIYCQDQTYKDKMILGNSSSEQLSFNYYEGEVDTDELVAKDTNGIVINMKLPVWAITKLGIDRTDPSAKKCNNVKQREIAIMSGTGLNMSGKAKNVWSEQTVDVGINTDTAITNKYRPDKPKFIDKGLTYRFNEIMLNNTIEPHEDWHTARTKLKNEVWYLNSRRYKNIRDKNTSLMTQYLGNIYTWGAFTFDPATIVEANMPFKWEDEDNCVYKQQNISNIISYKQIGTVDHTEEGSDEDFVENKCASSVNMSLIATLPVYDPPLSSYNETQQAVEYDLLYTDGMYSGSTFEDIPVSTEPLWPFAKVPKFNLLKAPITYEEVAFDAADNPVTKGWYTETSIGFSRAVDTVAQVGINYYTLRKQRVRPYMGDNPVSKGWYTLSGDTYSKSTDTYAQVSKDYYVLRANVVTVDVYSNPSTSDWYIKSGTSYIKSSDTEVKKYYELGITAIVSPSGSPVGQNWYEKIDDTYVKSTDTTVISSKTYYDIVETEVVGQAGDNPKLNDWFDKTGTTYSKTTDINATVYYELDLETPYINYPQDPSSEGWYIEPTADVYILSTDTVPDSTRTYYILDIQSADANTGDNPVAEGWYEKNADDSYIPSVDRSANKDKTYYKKIPAKIISGCYWTDGENYITDLNQFKELVLGIYDDSQELKNKYTELDESYNRTRIVKNYKAGFDFNFIRKSNFDDEQDYNTAVANWNETWKKYYPGILSPQTLFNETDVSTDSTYFDFYDIIIYKEVDPDIKYVTPGVYVNDFGSSYKAVPYACTSGLIIYNNDGAINLTAKTWHHSVDKTYLYHMENKHKAGYMSGAADAILPFYFGEATADIVVSGADTGQIESDSFIENKESITLKSASITLALNYTYQQHSDGQGGYYWSWDATSVNDGCWFGHVLAVLDGKGFTVMNQTVNANVETCGAFQSFKDINTAIIVAVPVWAYSSTRLVYPDIANTNTINDKDRFVLSQAPIPDNNRIYFDRGEGVKSLYLFNVIESSCNPDSGNGEGSFNITVEPVNGGYLYFAPKQFDEEKNEKLMDYYIPGIAWGSKNIEYGNMKCADSYAIMSLMWKPYAKDFPKSVSVTFSNKNTGNSSHRFYTTDKGVLNNFEATLSPIDLATMNMSIVLAIPTGEWHILFNGNTQMSVIEARQLLTNDNEIVDAYPIVAIGQSIVVPLNITLMYKNNKAKFIQLSNYTLVSSDGNKCVISNGTNQITYSISQQNTIVPDSGVSTFVSAIHGGQHVKVDGSTQSSFAGYFKAVYDGIINGSNVSFTWNGMTFNWDLSQQIDTGISVLSTDIRKPEKTNVIGKLRSEGQYQLLRQQWNTTVEVENFWWIDATHVLELNQHSFILKRNTKELDDWNGERFEKVFEIGRDKILPTNIIRYFTTNVYKSKRQAMFVTAQKYIGAVLLTFYDPRHAFKVIGTQQIRIRQHDIGQQLNDVTMEGGVALFNTYSPINAEQLLSKAEWSNTIVGDWLIIGCHLGNNYDQWAFVINLTTFTLSKCIQGYGYVGLHGDLTGGQIPDDYFDTNRGFNGIVLPLSVLKSEAQDINNLDAAYEVGTLDKINDIDAKVVGTGEQQWYIQRRLHGIVSHLTFDNGNFTEQLLPITNNFAAIYNSPSFASSVLADSFVQATSFASLFSFEGAADVAWQAFMALLSYPFIYSIAPRYAQLVYLQQTFGQYAYVHYNSSKSLPEKKITNSETDSGMSEAKNKQTDPVLSSSFTFDKQKFTQNTRSTLNYYDNILAILIASFAESLQFLDKKVAMNEEVNTSSIKDAGRKFVDNAVANTGDMLSSAIMTQSKNDSGITSVVTGIKSLDMFYSTSDQQRVFAGPGFVEHQMVANCVAQSVTDTHVEGKVQQFYFCIRALTTLQVSTAIALENLAADALDKAAEATASQMVCGTSLGAVAVGMHAAAAALRGAVKVQEIALVEIEKILDAICSRGITVNIDGQVSRHALSIEGKHKYGEKNETFMWPCFGIQPGQVKYTDEWVECGTRNTPWALTLNAVKFYSNGLMNGCNIIMSWDKPEYSQNKMGEQSEAIANCGDLKSWNAYTGEHDFDKPGDTYRAYYMLGSVPFYQASAVGKAEERALPDDMACIEGVCRFLPNEPFKNENISVSDPAFTTSLIHDFIIDKSWDLAQCATQGLAQWVTVKDTKITNCPPSNMIVNDTFCGVACPYSAIEVKRGIEKAYMRPWAITPNTLALNCTGYNTILQDKLYHAFDGISFRMVNLVGSPGMNKNMQSFLYSFQINDRFKRSNICPANELQGNFESEPVQAVDTIDKLYTVMTIASKEKGLEAGTIGEDKDAVRWAMPIFTEPVSTLPACVKTMTAATLAVVEGVTSLVTAQVTDTNAAYKAPLSVDFTIGKNVYRATEEYICSVQPAEAGNVITDIIPSLGLKFIGSTPAEAFFYSKATRCYYTFSGSSLTKVDMMERFRDIQKGYWDFVNQEVVMPCLMTFKRLNEEVEDKDTETDNIIIPVLSKGEVSGELPPPITTIFNDRSWYKCVSLPCGFAYQGPNRVIINRAVFCEYMERSVKDNYNKWKKMSRDKYVTHREYPETYDNIMKDVHGVDGWTYNPFVLVTSALGQSEDTDCMFEWNITFCWPIEMDLLYGVDNYACVNICAETMTPGGKRKSEVTHVFLTKELFTRNGSYGYYSFRFQSKNGMGNRERLHIWSDQYIAISSIDCESKTVTQRRTEQLTQQIDVQKLKEL